MATEPPIPPSTDRHVLFLDLVGAERTTADDRRQAVAILSELLGDCEAYAEARATVPSENGLAVVFLGDHAAPVRCALEMWELLSDLPSLKVRMGVHSGPGDDAVEMARKLAEGADSGQILLSESYAASLRTVESWASRIEEDSPDGAEDRRYRITPQRLVLVESGRDRRDGGVLPMLQAALAEDGHEVAQDDRRAGGVAWAKEVEFQIRSADTVVAVISGAAEEDEVLRYQLEIATDERRKRGLPQILPVWLEDGPRPDDPLGLLHRNLYHAEWRGPEDDARVVSDVRAVLAKGQEEVDPPRIDTAGGAVAADSAFYVERPADRELEAAITARESIVLVKGPRQIGKTSLIGRGIGFVDRLGWRCASTDFQQLSSRQLEKDADFYRVVAATLALQMDFDYDFETRWLDVLGDKLNMDAFVRALLAQSESPLVWFIDEADRLFSSPFGSDFFGLVRSWHNARATHAKAGWSKLTVVIGYATEAHLFIKDLNQSPFNVGRAVPMTMFTIEDLADLNRRYGGPIGSASDLQALYALIGGQPFLSRRALDTVARGEMDVPTLLATADGDDGPFGDHLKRLLFSVTQLPEVWEALTRSLRSLDLQNSEGLQRLVAAGILIRTSNKEFELACDLYRRYLAHHVHG